MIKLDLKIYAHYLALSPWQRFGRLPVTCVGGFAWMEWELHNSLSRERVWLYLKGESTLQMSNETILKHVVDKKH